MLRVQRKFDRPVLNRSVFLLARIVDCAGMSVQRIDVEAIEYSLYELDPYRPNNCAAVRGHQAIKLPVQRVIIDSLHTGQWTVDDVGYNFRHKINFNQDEPFARAGMLYDVRYDLTLTSRHFASMRFCIRC
jgi:hypothetical protein